MVAGKVVSYQFSVLSKSIEIHLGCCLSCRTEATQQRSGAGADTIAVGDFVFTRRDSNYLAKMIQWGMASTGAEELRNRLFGSKESTSPEESAPKSPMEDLIRMGLEGLRLQPNASCIRIG